MKLPFRKPEETGPPPLVLPMVDGTPAQNFQGGVVDNLRQMTTRLVRNFPLPQRLAMVSSLRQEGVTYLTRGLATTIAHDMHVRVCIVDLNWWWPSDSPLAARDDLGLAGVIAGQATLEEVVAPTGWSNLAYISAGPIPVEHRPVVARSPALVEIIDDLSERFDHLILDIPAIRATSDAVPLASLGEACCLVIRQGATIVEDVRPALDEIDHIPILGIILNKVQLHTPTWLTKLITNA